MNVLCGIEIFFREINICWKIRNGLKGLTTLVNISITHVYVCMCVLISVFCRLCVLHYISFVLCSMKNFYGDICLMLYRIRVLTFL